MDNMSFFRGSMGIILAASIFQSSLLYTFPNFHNTGINLTVQMGPLFIPFLFGMRHLGLKSGKALKK